MLHSRKVIASFLFSNRGPNLLNEGELALAIQFNSLGMSTFLKCPSTMRWLTFTRARHHSYHWPKWKKKNRTSIVVMCVGLDHWFSNLHIYQNHLEGVWGRGMLDSIPRVAYSVGLRWSLSICILHKFPGDSDAAGPGPHFESHYKSHTAA